MYMYNIYGIYSHNIVSETFQLKPKRPLNIITSPLEYLGTLDIDNVRTVQYNTLHLLII